MGTHIKLFADCRCTISESPMWNKKDNMLYWHGFDGEMYRKSLNDNVNNFERFQLNIGRIGSMVFTDKDYILLFAEGAKIWKWKPYESPVLCKDYNKSLFNDVICDPKGRIYCGMLADNYFNPEKRGKNGSFWLDADVHKICTGKTNELILSNLKYLSARGCNIEIRYPLVMEYNNNECKKIGEFLKPLNGIKKVKVLKYHSFSASRYDALGMTSTLPDTKTTFDDVENAVKILKELGLNAVNGEDDN